MTLRTSFGFLVVATLAACSAGDPPGTTPNDSGGTGASGGSSSTGGTSSTGGKGGGKAGSTGSGGTNGTSGSSGSGSGGGSSGTGQIGPSIDCTTKNLGSPLLRLLNRREFDATIDTIFPSIKGKWTDSLPSSSVSVAGFDNDASAVVGNQLAGALLDTALSVATAVTGDELVNLLPCAGTTKDRACAETFVDKFGQRLFRRPVAAPEKARYLQLFDTGLGLSDFPTALKWVTAGMIQSPYAVYRSEIGEEQGDTRTLDPYEVATQLAYTFSGTTPDEALLAKAAQGPIADPLAEARQLLQTEAGREVMQRFFGAYFGYTGVTSVVRANLSSGQANFATVSEQMLDETRAFISNVVLDGQGSLNDLLTSRTTYPSAQLAAFYGSDPTDSTAFPSPGGDGSVTRPDGQGIGILAQGSFLASHANTDASSPTLRGLFVYYRFLCRPKLTPPNGVPLLSTSMVTNTTRERYEVSHMQQGTTCRGCHAQFDPIGFGFEAFDEGGRFRSQQGGEPINAAAALPDEDGNPVVPFTTQEELANALAEQPEAAQCYAAYMATYAFGTTEACLGASQQEGIHDGSVKLVDAFARLAEEAHFTQRNAQ